MLEAQQLQLLETVTSLQRQLRDGPPPKKKARVDDSSLAELAEKLASPPSPQRGLALPSPAEIGKMDQEALRRTWEQIGTLGPLRKNAGVTTMRRAIKMHLRNSQ